MPPKKKEDPIPKLDADESVQLENYTLNVEREQIFKRMEMLGEENKKLTRKYKMKEKELEDCQQQLQDEKGRALQDRNDADRDRITNETLIRTLRDTIDENKI